MSNYVEIAKKLQRDNPALYTFKLEQNNMHVDEITIRNNLTKFTKYKHKEDTLPKFKVDRSKMDSKEVNKSSPISHRASRSMNTNEWKENTSNERKPASPFKVNNFSAVSSSHQSFDNFRPPIKKSMFSYPKMISSPSPMKKIQPKGNPISSRGNSISGLDDSSIARNFSLDKFKLKANDESNSMMMNTSMKKTDSNSSINFNKYKIHSNNFSKLTDINNEGSATNLFGMNSTPEMTNLWNGTTTQTNYGKVVLNLAKSPNLFKNKSNHEKESRRMIVEMLKTKMQSTGKNIEFALATLNVDANVLERPMTTNNQTGNFLAQQLQQSPMKNSLEFKNNKVEINNNYFGNVNLETASLSNTLKPFHQFVYNLDEDTNEKINIICALATPRIMFMNFGMTHKVPFVFQVSPSNVCFSYGIEHYVLLWNDVNALAPVGSIDMLKITSVSIDSQSNSSSFVIDTIKTNTDSNRYEVMANTMDECRFYVNALNFLSQLVKCKAYAFKGYDKINKA